MPTEPGVVVETRELGFSYGGRRALEQISFEARPGELVGVVGPNGSGKSTLIRVLSGVLRDYEGTATVGGKEVRDLPRRELAARLAVVPQEPVFTFPFTALEIVLMGRHPHLGGLAFESARDVRLARDAMERAGAAGLESRRIQQLSSGERQRVVFARALAQRPQVLLLDEPTSFLDVRHKVELYDTVRDLAADRRTTVVSVLHDLNLAAEYCDRVYMLHEGRLVAAGTTAEVFTHAHLTRTFETEVQVDTNALTGRLSIVPLSGRVRRSLRARKEGS